MDNRKIVKKSLLEMPLFLCNEDGKLPSFLQMGGDWDLIIELIESRKIFYSRLYKNRVTYLSNELYWCVKPYKQRWNNLSKQSQKIFSFVDEFGEITTSEIKSALLISNEEFSRCINELSKELFITAIAKEKRINDNWSSFFWGTYILWEKTAKKYEAAPDEVYEKLKFIFTEKQIHNMLR